MSSAETATFLLEIGVEELPAGVIAPAETALRETFTQWAASEGLTHGACRSFSTPRRLALSVEGLAVRQADRDEELLGPPLTAAKNPAGAYTQAALSFAKKSGVPVEALVVRTKPGRKGEQVQVVAAVKHHPGRPAAEVLAAHLPALITALPFPKNMHWEPTGFRFSRPLRWLVALLGAEVVPFSLAGVTCGRETSGHRFLSNGPVSLPNATVYEQVLLEHHVVAAPAERRRRIEVGLAALTADAAGARRVVPDEELVDQVNNLVEWPVPALGTFDAAYGELPREVLITVLRHHQRIFAVEDAGGKLTNHFAVILGTEPRTADLALKGFARVIRARLEDARYFFQEDRKRPLAARVADLQGQLYLKGLGTLLERTQRIERIAEALAARAAPQLKDKVIRAAHLAKADLTTKMVYEFPELQGIMGRHYAVRDGEDPEVAQALDEHYRPRGAADGLPSGDVGALVALAEKVDALAGCHAVGLLPKGSQDPYALRRAALGILRILEDRGYPLGFRAVLDIGFESLAASKIAAAPAARDAAHAFLLGRATYLFSERFAPDLVDAVLATGCDLPREIGLRLAALAAARREGWFDAAAEVFKRIQNISRDQTASSYDRAALREPAEKDLEAAYQANRGALTAALDGQDFARAIGVLGQLRQAVDRFFTEVLVMCDDATLRANRLGLLRAMAADFHRLADFTRIQGTARKQG